MLPFDKLRVSMTKIDCSQKETAAPERSHWE
jgi:hypothetical protein